MPTDRRCFWSPIFENRSLVHSSQNDRLKSTCNQRPDFDPSPIHVPNPLRLSQSSNTKPTLRTSRPIFDQSNPPTARTICAHIACFPGFENRRAAGNASSENMKLPCTSPFALGRSLPDRCLERLHVSFNTGWLIIARPCGLGPAHGAHRLRPPRQ
jgi:hypothetical protein